MSRRLTALPPGPKSPAAWQMVRFGYWPLSLLEECADRYGDPFTIRPAGFAPMVVVSSPDAVKDVFRGDPHILHSGTEFLSSTMGANSVLVLDDEPHARQRQILLPSLKGERMRSFFTAIQASTLEAVRAWPFGRVMRMDQPMCWITLRVILQAVLGLAPGAELVDFERRVQRLLWFGRSRHALVLAQLTPHQWFAKSRWMPIYRQVRQLDDALFALIASRRRAAVTARGDNVLADLLVASHADGAPLTDQEIRDAVVTLLMTGHDTTAFALAWALEQIVPRKDVMDQIVAELESHAGRDLPTSDQLPRLVYLDAAIRESLRLRTILPIVHRLTKQSFVADGREYPAGVLLSPCSYLVHRREDIYPDSAKFLPERFLEKKYAADEWFPFGGGSRVCLGIAFALYEMKVVLATLFSRLQLHRPPGNSLPVRRGITLAPHDGAQIVIQGRR